MVTPSHLAQTVIPHSELLCSCSNQIAKSGWSRLAWAICNQPFKPSAEHLACWSVHIHLVVRLTWWCSFYSRCCFCSRWICLHPTKHLVHRISVQSWPAGGAVYASFTLPCHFSGFIYPCDRPAMNCLTGSQYWEIIYLMVNFESYAAKIILFFTVHVDRKLIEEAETEGIWETSM